ncbi:hypothetical protein ES703_58974 [subsurface metagenome]
MTTNKLIKTAIFVVLLIAASCFLGNTCQRIGRLGVVIFSPSWDILYPFLWLLLALALVAITAGLVATLVRPLWMCFIAFALSSLAVLFFWGLNLVGIVLAVIYFLAGLFYSSGVAKGLDERINFSVHPIRDNQTILLIVLIIAASACFYSGCAEQIKNEGFTMPPFVINMVTEIAEGQIEGSMGLTPAEKEQAIAEFREQFEQQMQGWIEPYQQFIPIGLAFTLLGFLMTTVTFFSWIPILLLRGIFAILTACHVTNVVTETKEIKRLTLG